MPAFAVLEAAVVAGAWAEVVGASDELESVV